jgi:ADP-ribose pyrophosphatase YjhB (NUDIX family)
LTIGTTVHQPYYKLPGGALRPGEPLVDAVMREVLEETGVSAQFGSLVCLRYRHGYRIWQIRHLLRVSTLAAESRRDDTSRGNRRMLLDASRRLF